MADIVLKDKNGNPVVHAGVTGLVIPTASGGTQIFGSSGWASETLKQTGGTFTPTSNQMTISHKLGVVPDLIFVGRLDADDAVELNDGSIAWAIGWSRRMMNYDGFASGNAANNQVCIYRPYEEDYEHDGRYFTTGHSIDEAVLNADYGQIRNANVVDFTIGSASSSSGFYGLNKRVKYCWFAVSGIGLRMNQSGGV